jgi:hypothetical protein
VRHSPEWAIPHIKRLRSHPKNTGANIDCVIARLRKKSQIGFVEVSVPGVRVCRRANEDIKNK